MTVKVRICKEHNPVGYCLATVGLYRERLRRSPIVGAIIRAFGADVRFLSFRCLALGSPIRNRDSLYQLALLLELQAVYRPQVVSLFDPCFTEDDKKVLLAFGYRVEFACDVCDAHCLFFMPHADHDLTEEVVELDRPSWLLANHLLDHTERMPRHTLHRRFPLLSHLVKKIEEGKASVENSKEKDGLATTAGAASNQVSVPSDGTRLVGADARGFVPVTSRKKRRRALSLKIEAMKFDYDKCYFEDASVVMIDDEDYESEWGNAFYSLAAHTIRSKAAKISTPPA